MWRYESEGWAISTGHQTASLFRSPLHRKRISRSRALSTRCIFLWKHQGHGVRIALLLLPAASETVLVCQSSVEPCGRKRQGGGCSRGRPFWVPSEQSLSFFSRHCFAIWDERSVCAGVSLTGPGDRERSSASP